MNVRNLILSLMLMPVVSGSAGAQTDFDCLVDDILVNDLELTASRVEREAEIASDRASNLIDGPDVEFEHMWSTNPAVRNKMGLTVSQSFDWPGAYAARRRATDARAAAFAMLDRRDMMARRLSLKQLLIDIVYMNCRSEYAGRTCELFDSLLTRYAIGLERGEFSRLDYSKVKLSAVKARRAYVDVRQQLSVLLASLSVYNGGKPVGDIVDRLTSFPDQPFLSLAEYRQQQYDLNPDVQSASLGLDAARLDLTARKRELLPGFSVGYRFAREEGTNFHGLSFGMTLPFLYGTKSKLRGATMKVESAQAALRAVNVAQEAELMADFNKVETLRTRVVELTSAADVEECRIMLVKALNGGQISLIEFLLETDYYNGIENEILDFEYQYHLALARLNRYN